MASCADVVLPRALDGIGTIKLGNAQFRLKNKATEYVSDTYVWETSEFINEVPSLSTSTSQLGTLAPVDYGDGTVAL